jgi:hypothetical protein
MNKAGRTTLIFLAGLVIGVGAALLFAPRSGEETREWIADTVEREFKMLRRSGRRSMRYLRDTLAQGEEKFTNMFRDGKKRLPWWLPSWGREESAFRITSCEQVPDCGLRLNGGSGGTRTR